MDAFSRLNLRTIASTGKLTVQSTIRYLLADDALFRFGNERSRFDRDRSVCAAPGSDAIGIAS